MSDGSRRVGKGDQIAPGRTNGGPESKKQLIALPVGNKKAWAAGVRATMNEEFALLVVYEDASVEKFAPVFFFGGVGDGPCREVPRVVATGR